MPGKVQFSTYKGHPMIVLNPGERFPFQFGLSKAKLILEHIEAIRGWVASQEGSKADNGKRRGPDMTPLYDAMGKLKEEWSQGPAPKGWDKVEGRERDPAEDAADRWNEGGGVA